MLGQYGLGMLAAILSGVLNAFAAILQKGAVNRIPVDQREDRFMLRLLRSPAWLGGLAMSLGLGTVSNLLAQKWIGPALVPGLTASGLIVLAVASVRLIGERLRPLEVLGTVLMVAGIALLGWSRLAIPSDEVDLLDLGLVTRILWFSAALGACWFISNWVARQTASQARGLLMAVSGGFPFCVSNLWALPMMLTIGPVFAHTARTVQVLLFVAACAILVGTNAAGVRQTQEAYKFAPASKVQPVQQIPTQIVPILVYFVVFRRSASGLALLLIPVAVSMILSAGFLLGERKAEL